MLTKPQKPSKAHLEGKTKRTPQIMHPSARLMAQRQTLVLTSTLLSIRPQPAVRVVPHLPCHLRAVLPPSLSRIYPRSPPRCRKVYSGFNTVFLSLLLLAAGVGFPAACFWR